MSANALHPLPTRSLPPQPSLEQLKKQAKDLLQQYRAADPAAIAEVERFERSPDPASFALHDAQRVLARAYGYESWPRLKAFVDGATIARFAEAVKTGDMPQVRTMLAARPDLIGMDRAENDEHRALHYAVLRRDAPMVRLLMEAGADARKGIWPHRDATAALTLARDRGYEEIVAIIEEEERLRREELSCPNATISPVQDQITAAIVQRDNPTAIRLLTEDGSLIHACDREGASPLHIASQSGNEEMAAWLLDHRAGVRRQDINKQDIHGLTPLDRAALSADPRNDGAKRFPTIARLLLAHGAEVTLHAAVALADEPHIRELIAANPKSLRHIGPYGGLLSLAVNHGHIEIAHLLLDLGADADERTTLHEVEEPTLSWGQPLSYAALANQYAIVELLLDRGADPNANVYASGWPLQKAWNHEDGAVKRLLLDRGAKPQPYMVAEMHDVDEARRLLSADPDEHTIQELLWSAAGHGCPAIVELALPHLHWPLDDPRWHWVLIQPIRDVHDNPPGDEDFFTAMSLLLQHGISPNLTRMGQTPLHFTAARQGAISGLQRARFAAMLHDHGARLDLRDDILKSTPLGWACRWGRTELTQTLIARGAPIDEPDAESWATPKAWAQKMHHEAILTLLEEPRSLFPSHLKV
jgi:ankyrin repeat protein